MFTLLVYLEVKGEGKAVVPVRSAGRLATTWRNALERRRRWRERWEREKGFELLNIRTTQLWIVFFLSSSPLPPLSPLPPSPLSPPSSPLPPLSPAVCQLWGGDGETVHLPATLCSEGVSGERAQDWGWLGLNSSRRMVKFGSCVARHYQVSWGEREVTWLWLSRIWLSWLWLSWLLYSMHTYTHTVSTTQAVVCVGVMVGLSSLFPDVVHHLMLPLPRHIGI